MRNDAETDAPANGRVEGVIRPSTAHFAAEDPDASLLTQARAAEHVLSAIANGRVDLLTHGVIETLGCATRLDIAEGGLSWEYGGHVFLSSGAASFAGAALVATAPLEAPTLLLGSTMFALAHGFSALASAPEEYARLQRAHHFRQRYGFARDQLLWSLMPASTLFWYLQPGDTVYELAIKAKRGPLGLYDDDELLTSMLTTLYTIDDVGDGVYACRSKLQRLERAIQKSAADMHVSLSDDCLQPAWRLFERERNTVLLPASMSTVGDQAHLDGRSDGGGDGGDDDEVWVEEVAAEDESAAALAPIPSSGGNAVCVDTCTHAGVNTASSKQLAPFDAAVSATEAAAGADAAAARASAVEPSPPSPSQPSPADEEWHSVGAPSKASSVSDWEDVDVPVEDDAESISSDDGLKAAATGEDECAICLAAKRTHALLPCGHRCLCENCAAFPFSPPSVVRAPLLARCPSANLSARKAALVGSRKAPSASALIALTPSSHIRAPTLAGISSLDALGRLCPICREPAFDWLWVYDP